MYHMNLIQSGCGRHECGPDQLGDLCDQKIVAWIVFGGRMTEMLGVGTLAFIDDLAHQLHSKDLVVRK